MKTTIYIATHKKFDDPQIQGYRPILVGAALRDSDWGYLRDDSGENISKKNPFYSELTGLYWLWKNEHESDILGLVHYRRYFSEKEDVILPADEAAAILKSYDIIVSAGNVRAKNVREQYAGIHNIKDLDILREAVEKERPEYLSAFDESMEGKKMYAFNMMICRRDIFEAYCDFLFPVLFEAEKHIDISDYDSYNKRIYGFLSERLLYVFAKKHGLKAYESYAEVFGAKAESKDALIELETYLNADDREKAIKKTQELRKHHKDVFLKESDTDGRLNAYANITELRDLEKLWDSESEIFSGSDADILFSSYEEVRKTFAEALKTDAPEKAVEAVLSGKVTPIAAKAFIDMADGDDISDEARMKLCAHLAEKCAAAGKSRDSAYYAQSAIGYAKAGGYEEDNVPQDRSTLPILIYSGSSDCYDILNVFAKAFGDALERQGEKVERFDLSAPDAADKITGFIGRTFKAVIGFQANALNIFLKSKGKYLHDLIDAPIYNFMTDNPVWYDEVLLKCPEDYYVLTHDSIYIDFIKRYYPAVKDVFMLPPGGLFTPGLEGKAFEDGAGKGFEERPCDVAFMGTFVDYRTLLPTKEFYGPSVPLAQAFFELLRDNPNELPEKLLRTLLPEDVSDKDFLDAFILLRGMITAVSEYYREKVIRSLLERGIVLHVYGNSWNDNCSFAGDYENLIIHPEVRKDDMLTELSKAKLSLNIMLWHKDGFTERVANSMLAGCVLLTDKTRTLSEQYEDGKEMLLFDLEKIDQMTDRVKELIKDNEKLKSIAKAGYARASAEDTWDERAKLFLEYYLR